MANERRLVMLLGILIFVCFLTTSVEAGPPIDSRTTWIAQAGRLSYNTGRLLVLTVPAGKKFVLTDVLISADLAVVKAETISQIRLVVNNRSTMTVWNVPRAVPVGSNFTSGLVFGPGFTIGFDVSQTTAQSEDPAYLVTISGFLEPENFD